jgi:TetR/AcrR family transcriptional regulator, repressor of fatR-cypB operon
MVDTRAGTEGGSAAGSTRPGTRDAVLDAALSTFTEYTFGGAPVSLVADRAGVAVGSIYRHFPSKEALGNAVFRRWKSHLLEYLTRDAAPDEAVREGFGRLWRALLAFAADHPEAFAFLEYQQHEAYVDAQSIEVTDRIMAVGVELMTRGQRAGEIRPGDPTVLVSLVYGAFVGFSRRILTGPPLDPAGHEAAEAAVWDLVRAHP